MTGFIITAVVIIFVAVVAIFGGRAVIENVSPMPTHLGVTDGALAPCPDSPNCVSSLGQDTLHTAPAIPFTIDTPAAHARIVEIVNGMPNSTLVANEPHYLHFEFRSSFWRFIDDVEFYFDEEAGLVHHRSAARLGVEDFKVNRNRIEAITAAFIQ